MAQSKPARDDPVMKSDIDALRAELRGWSALIAAVVALSIHSDNLAPNNPFAELGALVALVFGVFMLWMYSANMYRGWGHHAWNWTWEKVGHRVETVADDYEGAD